MSRSNPTPQGRDTSAPSEPLTGDDKITFGKYKGWLVKDVAEAHPDYILWCQENIPWFDVSSDILDEIEEDAINREFKQVIFREVQDMRYYHDD